MTTKAEKLARELIALSQKYSDNDFDKALILIGNGPLFSRLVATVSAVKKNQNAVQGNSARKNRVANVGKFDLKKLLENRRDIDRASFFDFAEKIKKGELLPSGAVLRGFAEEVGLKVPKSAPSRAVLTERIVRRLLDCNELERQQLMEVAKGSTPSAESSLKRWSNLIVKPDQT